MSDPTTAGRTERSDPRGLAQPPSVVMENDEPRERPEPTPFWFIFGAMLLIGWGGWYLGTYGGGFRPDRYDEHPNSTTMGTAAIATPAIDPMVLGKRIYANCVTCHQANGAGVPGNYPPLAGSPWVTGSTEVLVRIVLHGVQGEMDVAGTRFNQVMPAWGHFRDEQLAAVLTYIRNSWENTAGPVDVNVIAAVRAATKQRLQPWRAGELVMLQASSPTRESGSQTNAQKKEPAGRASLVGRQ